MGMLTKILQRLTLRAVEGEVRPGPYYLPITGGWLPADADWQWFQKGGNIQTMSPSSMVHACVSAYSQTVAMCPGNHWLTGDDGGRERVTTSALCRILRQPNDYQTISDFLLNAVDDLYTDGNTFALALRNSRYEIQELHLFNPRSCQSHVATETGDIFYSLAGNEVIERQLRHQPLIVPARDVLHLRLNTSDWSPLRGESPMMAVAREIMANDAMMAQQIAFYLRQSRPSTVLSTDLQLDAETVKAARARWDEQSKGLNQGGVPILTAGLKPVSMATNASDSQLAEIMKLSEQRIALAYRIPLQILGIGNTNLGSTEELMRNWLGNSLGFCLNHIEEAMGILFGLKGQPDEYLEFDTSALLRSSMKERVESFARGVQSGIFEPNYARAEFGLPKVKFGDEPRVQAQVVPLSAAQGIPSAPTAQSSPSPQAPPKDTTDDNETVARIAREFITSADEFDFERSTAGAP